MTRRKYCKREFGNPENRGNHVYSTQVGVTQVEPRDPAIAWKRARKRPEARINERNGTKKSKEETHSQSKRRPLTEEKIHRGGLRGRRRERRRGRRRKGGNERVVHAMVEENVRGVGDVVHRYV